MVVSLALMLSHSIQFTPLHIQKTLLTDACFVSVAEGREARDTPQRVESVAAAHSVFTYY